MADTEAKKFLGELWASSASALRSDPSVYGLTRTEGWDVRYEQLGTRKFPEMRVFNQLLRELQGAFAGQMTQGIIAWNEDVNYARHAFVGHASKIWWSQEETGPATMNPSEPGSAGDTTWRLY